VIVCGLETIEANLTNPVFNTYKTQDGSQDPWLSLDLSTAFLVEEDCSVKEFILCEDSDCLTPIDDPERYNI